MKCWVAYAWPICSAASGRLSRAAADDAKWIGTRRLAGAYALEVVKGRPNQAIGAFRTVYRGAAQTSLSCVQVPGVRGYEDSCGGNARTVGPCAG